MTSLVLVFAIARGVQRVLTALSLENADPWTVAAASVVLATCCWLPLAAARGWLVRSRSLWLRAAPLGVVNLAVPGVAFTAAQLSLSAGAAALFVATLPVVAALLAAIFLRERLTRRIAGGLLLATGGVALLALARGAVIVPGGLLAGLLWCGLGVSAAASVYVSWRSLRGEFAPQLILAPQLVAASVVLVVVALLAGRGAPASGDVLILAGLGLTNYVLPQLAMFALLARTTVARSALPNFLAPLVAACLGALVLDQALTGQMAAAAACILAGAFLVLRRDSLAPALSRQVQPPAVPQPREAALSPSRESELDAR